MDQQQRTRWQVRNGGMPGLFRAKLFRKYVALFLAVVSLALVPKGMFDIWFSYQELKPLLTRVQAEQAQAAADKIEDFIKQIETQMAWATQLPLSAKTEAEWRLDAVRLLRQVPALTEISHLDGRGRERYRMSRQGMDVIGSLRDYSQDPVFIQPRANKVYYGPVFFLRQSEPYMTVAVGGQQQDFGVLVGQLNLKFIWDVVSQIKVGKNGKAYVVDDLGRLIADPDISLVLRNIDMSGLAQVKAARSTGTGQSAPQSTIGADLNGREVLSVSATVPALGWLVFAEVPTNEAFAPLYDTLVRSGWLLVAGMFLAVCAALFLAWKMVVPIRKLSDGAARIGGGDLGNRIDIYTGDELQALSDQFNTMAERLQDSYTNLERKVEERTRQLESANLAKSRFLAAASHDLRQPLHALGLFVAQLHGRLRADERKHIMARIDAALAAMNELFNALMDVSKLDAGALAPNVAEFPVAQLLKRIETTFSGAAYEKSLSLRIVGSSAWVRSDPILLERILSNLVANAIRYTTEGSVLVGCRRRGGRLNIEVWDSGPGIPSEQQENIFMEFWRLEKHDRGGLGLGLAIVDRLCRLLDHPLELRSTVGKGSCFAVGVPVGQRRGEVSVLLRRASTRPDISNGKLVAVIDDDPMVLDGMNGLLKSWGCHVVTGNTAKGVITSLTRLRRQPDVIISDYHLDAGLSGVDAIAQIRDAVSATVPAFLMTADNKPDVLQDAQAHGYPLLHKPVDPMALRATLAHAMRKQPAAATVP